MSRIEFKPQNINPRFKFSNLMIYLASIFQINSNEIWLEEIVKNKKNFEEVLKKVIKTNLLNQRKQNYN